ncbi:MAG: AhpC/TSA family protein [Bacteroidales bacterium]|nr:AhpC/TSA family protein [Bacteroidales bacterium]
MKNHVKYILGLAIILMLGACGNGSNEASDDEIIIEGRFIHSRGDMVYIDIIHVEDIQTLDSIHLDENGSFVFKYKTQDALFLRILVEEDNFITLIAEPGEHLTLSGDIKALAETYTVSGSPASELVAEHYSFTQKQYEKLDSAFDIWEQNKYADNKMELRDSIDAIVLETENEERNFTLNLVQSNQSSLGSLFILYQHFGRKPILDEFEYFDLYSKIAKNLAALYPSNEHVNHLNAKVNKVKLAIQEEAEIKARLDTGKVAPNFNLNDINDSPFSLEALRGYVVLLHFWGSWSPESMMQMNTIRYFNKTYGPRGLAIVSVSFDFDEPSWTKTVNDEKMTWYNICDFKHNQSPIARLYHVETIPFMYVLDREGKITTKSASVDTIGQSLYELLY